MRRNHKAEKTFLSAAIILLAAIELMWPEVAHATSLGGALVAALCVWE